MPWIVRGYVPAPGACASSRTRPSGDAGRRGTGPGPGGWPPALGRVPSPHPIPGQPPHQCPVRLRGLQARRGSPPFRGRRDRQGSLRLPPPPRLPARRHPQVRGLACSPRCSKLPSPPVAARAGSRGGDFTPAARSYLLALLAVLVLVHHQVVVCVRGPCGAGLLLLGRLAVENLRELVGGGHQILLLALDLLDVSAGKRFLGLLYGLLYLQLGVRVHLAVHILQRTLDGIHQVVSVIADVSLFAALPVLFGVRFRILHHLLYLRVREATGGRNRDPLLLTSPQVLGPDVDYAVRVYVESDLDLGYTPGGRRDADKLEVADDLVVRRDRALALVDLALDGSLVVVSGGEYLTLTRWYSGVPLDELGEHPALGLYTEGEWRDIEEQHVLDFSC